MLSARLSRAASIAALTLFSALIYVPAAQADPPPTYDAVVYDGGVNDGIVNGNGFVLGLPTYQPVVALDTSTGTVTVTATQVSNGAGAGATATTS